MALPQTSTEQPQFLPRHMVDFSELIDPSRVIVLARASDKEQLLQDLAGRAAKLLNLDAQTIFVALKAREELGSTGLGDGIALPHAPIEGLGHFFGMFARLSRPIHFDAIDGRPVDLVFLLLVPPSPSSENLALLAAAARLLRDEEFTAKLRKAASAAMLCNLICSGRGPR